ncbi:hypothetical protein F4859DRAFT_399822 [Xylaria cf. heliscus]|nr:hypothetical protein F4859DRAFT_399822 [Xylaria cf. heliscus]
MYNALMGSGLFRADSALEALLNDPQRLERARRRFNRSSPIDISPLGTTTQLQSPIEPDQERLWLKDRRVELSIEHKASAPSSQFEAEVQEEYNRIMEEEEDDERERRVPLYMEYSTYARKCVKERWVEQGIWNKKWKRGGKLIWRWKHEEPLEREPELQTAPETANESHLYPSHPLMVIYEEDDGDEEDNKEEDDEATQLIKKGLALRRREREASRPFYQFNYQVSKERERIQQKLRFHGDTIVDPADINSTAYSSVRKTWMDRGIWDKTWGVLPGMSWIHERSMEEWIEEEMKDITYPGPESPPERHGPVNFSEINLRQFRYASSSLAELNRGMSPATSQDDQERSMIVNPARSPDALHNSSPRHTTPLPPLREKRRIGRPRRGSEKPRPDLPPRDSSIPPRRSKRLQDANTVTVLDTTAGPGGPVNRGGRPKRSEAKAENSARELRGAKRRSLKQKRANK